MRVHLIRFAAFVVVAAVGAPLAADVKSGPATGTEIPALKALWLNDSDGYEEKELAQAREKKATAYVFVQASEWSRPMARFLRGMDDAAAKLGAEVAVIAVWVGDDVDASKEYLPRGRGALKLRATEFAVHPGDKTGPDGWGINDRAFLTAVIAKDGKVSESFAFISVNGTDVPKVAEVLGKAAQ